MKKNICFILFLILTVTISAQNAEKKMYKYYRIYGDTNPTENPYQTKTKIKVDDGITISNLKSGDGKDLSFKSVVGAVNFLGETKGWEFVQVYTVEGEKGTSFVCYLMREEFSK